MFRRLAYLFGLLASLTSGAYLFVYLYRWEWNRAVMAGLFFIIAEIGLATAAILERIKSIESSISQIDRTEHAELLARLRENDTDPKERFAWLTKDSELSVFIPFLMGAGFVASAIAWGLERIARSTAKPVLEYRLAVRLAPVAMPAGGLTGPPGVATPPVPSRSRVTINKQLVALVFAILAGTLGLDVLSDATQTRPDTFVAGSESVVTIELRTNGSIRGLDAVAALWGTCQGTVPNDLTDAGFRQLSGNRYSFNLEPALGKNGERRLRGCLSDATIDNVQSRVASVEAAGT